MKLHLLLLLLANLCFAQKQEKDIWSGEYLVLKYNDSIQKFDTIDTLIIKKSEDIIAKDVAAKYESDLKRWKINSKSNLKDDPIILRRFLFDLKDSNNEYEEFNWTKLHQNNEMNCADAGHFFIFQSKNKGEISIGDEKFISRTGIFGIQLHYGLFELEKIN